MTLRDEELAELHDAAITPERGYFGHWEELSEEARGHVRGFAAALIARTRVACEKELAELRAALQTITNARQTDGETIARLQHELQKAEAELVALRACEKELAELRAALQTITNARQTDGETIARLQHALQKAEAERDDAVGSAEYEKEMAELREEIDGHRERSARCEQMQADAFSRLRAAKAELRAALQKAEAERDKAQLRYESEAALVRKMVADFSAARVGIMARQGELHEHLSLIVRYLEEETSQGDGISEEHFDGYVAAKSVLARTAPDAPSWENAQFEVHQLLAKASEVPGLSATVDELRHERDRAVRLLHMLDNPEARHPDVAEFLDGLEQIPAQAPADAESVPGARPWRVGTRVPEHVYDAAGRPLVTMPSAELAALVVERVNAGEPADAKAEARRDGGANCHRCGHYELSFARAERELAHCPSCGKHTRWLAAERAERGREAMSEPRRRAEGGAA